MKTNFSSVQLARPEIAKANSILSKCTNCGCCNAACPTYEITGDEREAPRGRINLIREMLEQPGAPKPATVQHLDNCLSCLSCTVVCPSDVDYMHLIDHARVHIEETHKRPLGQRLTRQVLSYVLPHSKRFRAALAMGRLARPLSGLLRRNAATKSLSVMLDSLPSSSSSVPAGAGAGTHLAADKRLKRVILPGGCVQKVLDPGINRSTVNLLTGVGVEVVIPKSNDCCGALNYHLGKEDAALSQIRRNIDAWCAIIDTQNVDAIVITASGCGTTIMDYGNILKDNPQYAEKAARVSRLAMDVTTFLGTLSLPPPRVRPGLRVAYHAACSLQHGQGLLNEPKNLLRAAGFTVLSPKDEHMCCGSAGTYSILQPEMSQQLRNRKVSTLENLRAEVIAGGNMGCLQHIGAAADLPVLHTVMLLEWAWIGKRPEALAKLATARPMAATGIQRA